MATVTKPIALDESFNTTEVTPRNIADVLAEGLSHITGRTASEVEYDNTESELTADNVQDALDEIVEDIPTVPSVDIQTAVDEFETYNGGLLSSCKVSLSPNQDLHGYDNPWVGGSRKNKCPLTVDGIKSANTTVTWNGNSCILEGVTITILTDNANNVIGLKFLGTASHYFYFNVNSNFTIDGTYIISPLPQGAAYSSAFYGRLYYTDGTDTGFLSSEVTVTKQNAVGRMQIVVSTNVTVDFTYQPMIRLATESDPTFEPYSNICPISGHTQVKMGDDGKNLCDPTVIPLNGLGGDHYVATTLPVGSVVARIKGGKTYTVSIKNAQTIFTSTCKEYPTVDAPMIDNYAGSGGLSVTSKTITTSVGANYLVVNTGSNNYEEIQIEEGSTATAYEPYNGYQATVNLGGTYYSGTLDVVSGVLTVDSAFIASYNGETLPSTWISDRDVYAVGTTPTTGAEVCYKLATPTSIQLSPTMVKALVGENHLSAPLDGQEITESKYKQMFTFDDVIAYIQSLS